MSRYVGKLVSLGLVSFLLISGCTKNSSPTEPQQTAPSLPSLTLRSPNTNSTDQNPQTIKSYVTSVNSYTLVLAPLKFLQPVQNGNTWTWTYTQGALTVKFSGTNQADGSAQWMAVVNGTDSSGTTFTNWTAAQGTTSADGKTGDWKIYDTSATTIAAEISWTTVQNVLTGTLKTYSGGVFQGQAVIINNSDNSGQLTLYSGSSLTYKAAWLSNGSGQWWTYDPDGTQTGTGNWT
jgi:hypothetical protein